MRETGHIVRIEGINCLVEFTRTSACESCGACTRFGEKSMSVTLPNSLNAQVGDFVCVEMSAKSVVGAGMWAYIFPLCMLLLGARIGKAVLPLISIDGDLAVAIIALGFTGLSYLILKLLDPYFAKRKGFKPVMVEILQP